MNHPADKYAVRVVDIAEDPELWTWWSSSLALISHVYRTRERMVGAALDTLGHTDSGTRAKGRLVETGWTGEGELTLAERRLIVAWTWPDEIGAPEYFLPLDRPDGMPPELYMDFRPRAVKSRVARVCEMLARSDRCADEILALQELAPDMANWHFRALRAIHPLCVEDILKFSDLVGVAYRQIDDGGPSQAWHFTDGRAATIRAWANVLHDPDGPIARLWSELAEAEQQARHVADVTTSATAFGALLPDPPAPGTKYRALFQFLDGLQMADDETKTFTVDELAEVLDGLASQRGTMQVGLPAMARSKPTKFWVNHVQLHAMQRDEYRREHGRPAPRRRMTQPRAWRATGLSAKPVKQVRGHQEVMCVAFTPDPGREAWWPVRHAIRAGERTHETPLESEE